MELWSLLLLAFGLSMDATAVAASCAFRANHIRVQDYLFVSMMFGGFQALMPVVGWILISQAGDSIKAWDHWIVFALLFYIGAKMVWDALRPGTPECTNANPFRFGLLFPLAIATSVDALAAGIALPLMGARLLSSVVVIGITTAVLSSMGMLFGKIFGLIMGKRFGALGGLVLIFLAIKTLTEHLVTDGMH